MKYQKLNISIVDDNKLVVIALKNYLTKKFGTKIKITSYYDGESCLKKIGGKTNIVILDYYLNSENKNAKNGLEIIKAIKKCNSQTEVIMLSGNEDIAIPVEARKAGAIGYIVKGDNALDKLILFINKIIAEPVRLLVKEYGVSKFLAIFIFVFIGMAAIVIWMLNIISY